MTGSFRKYRNIAIIAMVLLLLPAGILFTADKATGAERSLTFAVIGDTGTGDDAQMAVARQLAANRVKRSFEFVLMLGDNIYETGREKYIGSHFEEPYKDLLDAGVKFYAVLGNHDIIKGLEFQTNYPNFNMGGRRYYNFVKGDGLVEYFALDSNEMTSEQLAWLEDSLSKSTARWKVAYSHHPIYSSARMHRPYVKLRNQLEPLYVKYGVNAVFSGHSHCYERVKPQKGVHYFVEGASGEIKRKTLDKKNPLFDAGEDSINSFLIIDVNENEFKVEARGSDDRVIDSYVVRHSDAARN